MKTSAAVVILLLLGAAPAWAAGSTPAADFRLEAPALLAGEVVSAPTLTDGVLAPSTLDAPALEQGRLHSTGTILLIGLSLIGTGLIAGGAGFAVLLVCFPDGELYCEDDTTRVVGWVLAAPGVLPLIAGGILVYVALEAGSSRYGKRSRPGKLAFSASPVPGGGMAYATMRF